MAGQLTDLEMRVLDVERHWWRYSGMKETAIRDKTGLSKDRYYLILANLLDSEAALAHDPMLIRRLTRLRDMTSEERAARRRQLP